MEHVFVIFFIAAGMVASVALKKLTPLAALTGGILGVVIFLGSGWTGLSILTTFFVLGTVASAWQRGAKEKAGFDEENKGQRTAGQVFANAGVAACVALLSILNPGNFPVYMLMIAAAFSSATADTLSSELGNVYGKTFYNIVSFKKDKRGLDGVISLEGTLFGLAGSIAIALLYALGIGLLDRSILWIVVAGTAGNIADSAMGATMERAGMVKNNAVNFFNTLVAAIIGGLLAIL